MILNVIPDGELNALYTGFVTLLALLINGFVSYLRAKKHKFETSEKLETISREVKDTKKELSTNGGDTTMKDVVNNINSKVDLLAQRHEIFERKLQEIIAQARARTELALDQSNTPQFLANEKCQVDYVNDAMSELFGLTKSHCMFNKWMVAIESQTQKEEIEKRMLWAIARRFNFTFDVPIKNQKTGISTNVTFTVEPRLDADGIFLWNLGKFKIKKESNE